MPSCKLSLLILLDLADSIAATLEPRWPPRSPHEALLSSPSGRSKLRRQQQNRQSSRTPSPLRRLPLKSNVLAAQEKASVSGCTENSDEEDEETLQLKLQALEAKLRLKQLQQKKSRQAQHGPEKDGHNAAKENLPPDAPRAGSPQRPSMKDITSSAAIHIAVSPQKRPPPKGEAQSPRKVLLGIDKGLTGKDVSLGRRPSQRNHDRDVFHGTSSSIRLREAGLSRTRSLSNLGNGDRPKTFSERIAQSRQEDRERQQRAVRARGQQSSGFGIRQEVLDAAKHEAESAASQKKQDPSGERAVFSREEILQAANKSDSGLMPRSNATLARDQRSKRDGVSRVAWQNPNAEPERPVIEHPTPHNPKTSHHRPYIHSLHHDEGEAPQDHASSSSSSSSDSLFEPFSSINLSRRVLSHDLLTRTFAKKSILLLPHLLREVKSPDFSLPPDLETDYVVLAAIASKSNPLTRKDAALTKSASASTVSSTSYDEAVSSEQNVQGGKYMVLSLTDLKWNIDLYLFDTAYTRFWKLDPGTVIAILNPSIMPPPRGKSDTGRFSLVLNSSDDTVLEIGTARDLGWCSSLCKTGKPCAAWVDKRHTSVCEFHVDRVVEQARRGRMEVQGMSAPFAPGGRDRRTGHYGVSGRRKGGSDDNSHSQKSGLVREGPQYDRESRSTYFMAAPSPAFLRNGGGGGNTAAQLLDAELDPWTRGSGSKEERLRRRLAEREREDDIARKLGDGGNGAGSEYLRRRRQQNASTQASSVSDGSERPRSHFGPPPYSSDSADPNGGGIFDAASLRNTNAQAVHLSPLKKQKKRKSLLDGVGSDCRSGDGADDDGAGAGASVRKKTRFVTAKGIREAGRDSLGGASGGGGGGGGLYGRGNDDDDDELEVV